MNFQVAGNAKPKRKIDDTTIKSKIFKNCNNKFYSALA